MSDFWIGKLTDIARNSRVEVETLDAPQRLAAVRSTDVQALIAKFVAGRQPVVIVAQAKRPKCPGAKVLRSAWRQSGFPSCLFSIANSVSLDRREYRDVR